ncbi:MAG: TauD/TfdA family dioxygenase [Pseudomonadales bacterium]|nr:TauD/TfdA family dioxygenase [Pseudomonadales bacterium]MDP6471502.1 TauD/TfdA family dioxygenase [Pseudomonadales bacterium]MDP6829249.1 TauD/TfdA family dioxygenase [Pseudomonadales bacterium]MDP6970627.1 TauD/TfdA family dioxygenase [Pseudomonadales bacterium]
MEEGHGGGGWHTDHSYDQIPALGSILVARKLPSKGGNMMYASMCAAFDPLSDGLKETLCRLDTVHSSRHVFGPMVARPKKLAHRLGNREAAARADMTFFKTPSGGAVFSTGSISYAGARSVNGYDNDIARITGNVWRRFADPEPFEYPDEPSS